MILMVELTAMKCAFYDIYTNMLKNIQLIRMHRKSDVVLERRITPPHFHSPDLWRLSRDGNDKSRFATLVSSICGRLLLLLQGFLPLIGRPASNCNADVCSQRTFEWGCDKSKLFFLVAVVDIAYHNFSHHCLDCCWRRILVDVATLWSRVTTWSRRGGAPGLGPPRWPSLAWWVHRFHFSPGLGAGAVTRR